MHPAPGSGLGCGQRQRRQPARLYPRGVLPTRGWASVGATGPNNAPAGLQRLTARPGAAARLWAPTRVPPPCRRRRASRMRDSAASRPAMPDRGKSARRHRGQRTRGSGAPVPEKPGAAESVPPSAFGSPVPSRRRSQKRWRSGQLPHRHRRGPEKRPWPSSDSTARYPHLCPPANQPPGSQPPRGTEATPLPLCYHFGPASLGPWA